jgi:hypothetical protein
MQKMADPPGWLLDACAVLHTHRLDTPSRLWPHLWCISPQEVLLCMGMATRR